MRPRVALLLAALTVTLPPFASSGTMQKMLCEGQKFTMKVTQTVVFSRFALDRQDILVDGELKDLRYRNITDHHGELHLVLDSVTYQDGGLYQGVDRDYRKRFRFNLTVRDCSHAIQRYYGTSFQITVPQNATTLQFARPNSEPIAMWNRTDPSAGRNGRVTYDGHVWTLRTVTPADQGVYTVKDRDGGNLFSYNLTVKARTKNLTVMADEPIIMAVMPTRAVSHILFYPNASHDYGPWPRTVGPVVVVQDGDVVQEDNRFLNSVFRDNSGTEFRLQIEDLKSYHSGRYDVLDDNGFLISSTTLLVLERYSKLRSAFKSFSVPGGVLTALLGLFLFLKRYPDCFLARIICCRTRSRSRHPVNAPRINGQDHSSNVSEPSHYGYSHHSGRASPKPTTSHTVFTRVQIRDQRDSTNYPHAANTFEEPSLVTDSFKVPGMANCLHTSEDCVQFQIKGSAAPLERTTVNDNTVYTSDKLNFR